MGAIIMMILVIFIAITGGVISHLWNKSEEKEKKQEKDKAKRHTEAIFNVTKGEIDSIGKNSVTIKSVEITSEDQDKHAVGSSDAF